MNIFRNLPSASRNSGGISVATNDTFALFNPYYAWFVQDSWRLSEKLTLSMGLRVEYERARPSVITV